MYVTTTVMHWHRCQLFHLVSVFYFVHNTLTRCQLFHLFSVFHLVCNTRSLSMSTTAVSHYYCIDTCVNCFTFFLFFLDHSEGMDYCIDTGVNCFTFFLFFLDHSGGMDYCIDTGVNCFTFFSVFHLVQQSQQNRERLSIFDYILTVKKHIFVSFFYIVNDSFFIFLKSFFSITRN